MKNILKLTPAKAAGLLEQVLDAADEDPQMALLEREEVSECIDKEDLQTVTAHVDHCKGQRDLIRATRKFLREEALAKDPKKRKPCTFKANETWTAEMAMALAPPSTRFYRDQWNKRWLCWAGEAPMNTRWCRSRSWGITGDDNRCIQELLNLVWTRHCEITGEDCPLSFGDEEFEVKGPEA